MRSLIRSVTREVGGSQTGTSSGLTRSVNSRTLGVSLTRSIQVAYDAGERGAVAIVLGDGLVA